jgi:alkylhydroperoxidase family enzyme
VSEQVRATLGFIEKQTLRPDELAGEDAESVYAAGVARQALLDAAVVAGLFNMIVRLADAFGWSVPDWDRLMQRAPAMLEGGYLLGAIRTR